MRCPVLDCTTRGSMEEIDVHLSQQHPEIGSVNSAALRIRPFVEIRAFKGYLRSYRQRYSSSHADVLSTSLFFKEVRAPTRNIIFINTSSKQCIKTQFSLLCEFERGEIELDTYEVVAHYINSHMNRIFCSGNFDPFYNRVIEEINTIIDIFNMNGSGWKLKRILGLDIRIAKARGLRRTRSYMEIPKELKLKHALINVKNNDSQCFKWAFLSIAHYKDVTDHRDRTAKYTKFEKLYNFSNIKFPPDLSSIEKFERQNLKHKLAINIFEYVDAKVQLRLMSPYVTDKQFKPCDLLLLDNDLEGRSHFVGIVSIGKLFGKAQNHKVYFCYNCQNFFNQNNKSHVKNCSKFRCQRVQVPDKNDLRRSVIYFKNFYKQLAHEFVMYLDIESIMNPLNDRKGSCTKLLAEHIPCGYFLLLVSRSNGIVDYDLYRGENVYKHMFETIQRFALCSKEVYNDFTPMKSLTKEEVLQFNKASVCYICNKPLLNKDKVRDHDHATGFYRGASHKTCNSQFTPKNTKIPIFCHNLKNYDAHIVLNGFKYYQGEITILPNNAEKFLSIICDNFIFLDSFMFLSASLDTLVKRLSEDKKAFNTNFKLLIDFFGQDAAIDFCRKGVYFYDYITDFKMFEETKFPKQKDFYNKLSESDISVEDYRYAKYIYKKYCQNLGDYHDKYLICDVLNLACVFENFRTLALQHYGLDPAHFYSLSGFTWEAALKMTNIRLQLFTDIDMYELVELGMRGGISMIPLRHAKANNPYLKDYDAAKKSSYILPLDCNGLYAAALSEYLPVSDFKWESKSFIKSITTDVIQSWGDYDSKGFILQVSISYPKNLHDEHNMYPLCPEKLKVTFDMLSDVQREILQNNNNTNFLESERLIPHLGTRRYYVVHYRCLKYYLEKGLKLIKIHKIMSFTQKPWLKPYIDFNTEERKKATDSFSKDLFKFMINATFGKSCENVRKRRNIFVINRSELCEKITSRHNFKMFHILNENLAIVEMEKSVVTLNKPVYTGFACLDISKLIMFKFHYDVIKEYYGNRAQLLNTDTDSLHYFIESFDVYEDMFKLKTYFDTSDYPTDHFLYSPKNKKIVGKFKDESNGIVLKSFYGLSSKMYSHKGKGLWKKGAKGIKKSVVDKKCKHNMFRKAFKQRTKFSVSQNLIRSYKHKLYTIRQTKTSLNCFDVKRFILNDGIHTLAYNHYLIAKLQK